MSPPHAVVCAISPCLCHARPNPNPCLIIITICLIAGVTNWWGGAESARSLKMLFLSMTTNRPPSVPPYRLPQYHYNTYTTTHQLNFNTSAARCAGVSKTLLSFPLTSSLRVHHLPPNSSFFPTPKPLPVPVLPYPSPHSPSSFNKPLQISNIRRGIPLCHL